MENPDFLPGAQLSLAVLAVLGYVLILSIFGVAALVYRAGVRNVAWSATTFDGRHRLLSDLSRLRYTWIAISNFVVTLVTIGLMRPWAAVTDGALRQRAYRRPLRRQMSANSCSADRPGGLGGRRRIHGYRRLRLWLLTARPMRFRRVASPRIEPLGSPPASSRAGRPPGRRRDETGGRARRAAACRLDRHLRPGSAAVPRRVTFPDGSLFETADNDAVDRFLAAQGAGRGGERSTGWSASTRG